LLLLLLGSALLFAAREKVVNPLVVGGRKENPWLLVAVASTTVVGTTNHVGIIGSISGMLRKEVAVVVVIGIVVVVVAVANGVGLWRACCPTGRSNAGECNGFDGTLSKGVVDGGHLALWHRLSFRCIRPAGLLLIGCLLWLWIAGDLQSTDHTRFRRPGTLGRTDQDGRGFCHNSLFRIAIAIAIAIAIGVVGGLLYVLLLSGSGRTAGTGSGGSIPRHHRLLAVVAAARIGKVAGSCCVVWWRRCGCRRGWGWRCWRR